MPMSNADSDSKARKSLSFSNVSGLGTTVASVYNNLGVPVVLKLPKNKTIRIRREAELSRVMKAVERLRAGQGTVVRGVERCDIVRAKWRMKKRGIRFIVRNIGESVWNVERVTE